PATRIRPGDVHSAASTDHSSWHHLVTTMVRVFSSRILSIHSPTQLACSAVSISSDWPPRTMPCVVSVTGMRAARNMRSYAPGRPQWMQVMLAIGPLDEGAGPPDVVDSGGRYLYNGLMQAAARDAGIGRYRRSKSVVWHRRL